MLPALADLKQEFRPMAALAMPVVVAEIGIPRFLLEEALA